jgi:hypothetical protein
MVARATTRDNDGGRRMNTNECRECKRKDTDVRLSKCPICFKYFCEDHAVQRSGLAFCSTGCAEYFFFSDPDE